MKGIKKIRIDLTGMEFGFLTVDEYSHTQNKRAMWKCKCSCGTEIIVRTCNLRNGNTTSCGCKRTETMRRKLTKYEQKNKEQYNRWKLMKARCSNSKHPDFKYYGGRGITVCEEWKNDFQAFYNHISQLPHFGEAGYTLDRIDNNGNYEPNNVRWATMKEQNNNKRQRTKKADYEVFVKAGEK